MPTIALQRRTARVSDLEALYVVETTVTDRGDLPTSALFVLQIIEDADPKADELLRTATVADIIDLEQDRATALRRGQSIYRATTAYRSYADVNAARAAALFLEEKLNQLVVEYQTYLTDFVADPGEVLTFPMADPGVLTPAIEAYVAKRDERIAQELTNAEQTAQCTQTSTEVSALSVRVAELTRSVEALEIASTSLRSCLTALQAADTVQQAVSTTIGAALSQYTTSRPAIAATPQAALDTYLLTPGGDLYDDLVLRVRPQIARNATSIAASSAQLLEVNTRLAAVRSDLSTAQAELEAKKTAEATCAREQAAAAAILEELERQEQALLDAVLDLCPDYSGT